MHMGDDDDDEKVEKLNLDDGEEEGEEEEGDRGDDVAEGQGEEGDPDAKPAKGSRTVPHARFNEVNESLKTEREERLRLEGENRALKAGSTKTTTTKDEPAFDFDAKEEEYGNALMEGDSKKAGGIRREINAQIQKQAREEAVGEAVERMTVARTKELLEEEAAAIIEDHPELDAQGDQYDKALAADVVEWRNYFIQMKGDKPHVALRKAVARVIPAGKAKGDEDDDEDTGKQRKVTSITKAASAANRQPPPLTGGIGARASASSRKVEALSDEDFKKLPDKEKRAMRGDNL